MLGLTMAALSACAPGGQPTGSQVASGGADISSARPSTNRAPSSLGDTTASRTSSAAPPPEPAAGPNASAMTPTPTAATAAALPGCTATMLTTRTAGVLTFGTGPAPDPPWFQSANPGSGEGFEAAVAVAVAAVLGFSSERVVWAAGDSAAALAGAPMPFDVLIDQIREGAWDPARTDASSGYFDLTDALVMPTAEGAKINQRGVRLDGLIVGAVTGTRSEAWVRERGARQIVPLATAREGLDALAAGDIDALIMPTSQALRDTAGSATLTIVGQLPAGQWQPEQLRLVLAKGSPLTPCVSAAVDRLRVEGTLADLASKWISTPLAPPLS
ncbi:MAG: polar amino acid transport system substrate-binding protein [Actinomycetota bacterium]|nr:polar amino acid transport system substrate-binding protein [Actinomycetota bacterium]